MAFLNSVARRITVTALDGAPCATHTVNVNQAPFFFLSIGGRNK